MRQELVTQCLGVTQYMQQCIADIELNDICYSYDILCYLLSAPCTSARFAAQHDISDKSCDKKIEMIYHCAKFAFDLDLEPSVYRNIGINYIELLRFTTKVMKEISIKDELTGALNFNYLKSIEPRLSKEYFLLFFFDLNGLKMINDVHGHEKGNQVLHSFATSLAQSVRVNDLFFRYGGDEFIIILLRERIQPMEFIGRINQHMDDNIAYSVGWAYNQDFDLFKTIKIADQMMYQDKRKAQ